MISSSMFSSRLRLPAALLFGVALLAGCSSTKEPEPYVERPVEQLYNEAHAQLENKEYETAAKSFDEVERQHPYSPWATRAKLMSAYAHYQSLHYDDAVVELERYIQLHPGSEDIAYAYYLRALCFYEQITDVKRDQKITKVAMDDLQEVIRRFPNTEYARDAQLKYDLTVDHLAGKEMDIGRWYLRQGQYQAAIGRFKEVIDKYQTTSHVPEALHRLVEAYLSIGLREEAERTATVLGANFPGSSWYQDSYALLRDPKWRTENDEGFFSRAWNSIVN
ncbi:outer membrane protein assembly factor BamD [Radicibacter daui]|uniref:outer membrane protein assembly factor BamD n=1 Tax=Radicibacter daui TaxID=3064829 RepID=UPI004046A144